jgi:hypothetical protein
MIESDLAMDFPLLPFPAASAATGAAAAGNHCPRRP